MNASRRAVLLALSAVLVATPTSGWVRLHTSEAVPYAWPGNKLPLGFVLNDAGSDDVPDASEDHALRRAFAVWEDLAASSIAFVEDTDPAERARSDWAADDIHLVLFDEDDASGFFPPGAATVAVTPVEFELPSGRVVDADILFNGGEFSFGTRLEPGRFDVRAVGTHEIGHVIGLSHTAVGGATMAPFTTPQGFAPRSLQLDDIAGAAALYPVGASGAITGSVTALGAAVDGAHVWARRAVDGRVVSAGFSRDGSYTLTGLSPGDYVVCAGPTGDPLAASDMYGSPAAAGVPDGFDQGFSPASTAPLSLSGSALVTAPALELGPDTLLRVTSPLVTVGLRRGVTGSLDFGVSHAATVASVEVPGTEVAVDSFALLGQNALRVTFSADADGALGLYDVVFTDEAGSSSIWGGFLELLPEALQIDALTPSCLTEAGGGQVITGWGLGDVGEVLLGDTLGVVSAVAPDGGWLMVQWPPLAAGSQELVVVDVTGDQVQAPLEVVTGAPPTIHSVFPTAGYVGGGTVITVLGSGFDADTEVALSGLPATVLDWKAGRLHAVTPALVVGSLTVSVRHGCCPELEDMLVGGFTAVAAPDPVITAVAPSVLSQEGGDAFSVFGSGFDETSVVKLFVSPFDGSGGLSLATSLGAADRLDALSPSSTLPLGDGALLVLRADGAAGLLSDAVSIAPSLGSGVRYQGSLNPPGDVDPAFVDGLAGTVLGATAKRLGKSSLELFLTLSTEAGVPVASSDPGHPAFDAAHVKGNAKTTQLVGLVLPDTQRYLLEIGALSGTGSYRVSVKEKLPASARRFRLAKKDAQMVGPGTYTASIDAKAHTLLTGRLLGDKLTGMLPTLNIREPGGELVLQVADGGALSGLPEAVAAVTLSADGRVIKLQKLRLPSFGSYSFEFGAAGDGSGMITAAFSLRAPREKLTALEWLLPD